MRRKLQTSAGIFVSGLIAVGVAGIATPAHAQATRTWVSGVGDDVNPCSRTAPCKTFAGAISKTATGGEINCLDPGGFGTINITKSIVIDCRGTHGSILAANVNGVLVNGAGVSVVLRNLTINGAHTTTGNGVRVLQASSVLMDNVVIENFQGSAGSSNGRGVSIETATAGVRVSIINSQIHRNNNMGVQSDPTAGNVLLTMDGVSILDGGTSAIRLVDNTQLSLSNSVLGGHTAGSGLLTEASTNLATLMNTAIVNNSIGITNGVGGGAPTTRLFGNVIAGNTANGILISGGTVQSFGNNGIAGNSGNNAPSSNIGPQ